MQEKKGISAGTLKIIAVISMLVDHTAAVLLESVLLSGESPKGLHSLYMVMRGGIGRLAFPIYCFLLVEGFERTRNRRNYALRMLVFAFLSEIPFDLAFHGKMFFWQGQNVFVTLFLGLVLMTLFHLLETKQMSVGLKWAGKIGVFLIIAVLAELSFCDYGAKGIVAIMALYLFRAKHMEQIIAGCIAFCWEITAPLAFIPIAFYKGRKGINLKYVFYFFYPVHLLVLYGIKMWFFV